MEFPKEYECAAFIEQKKLQAQLQPWKGDLVKLAAEFNSLNLEDVHGEVTSLGRNLAKKYDESIAALRKARDIGKAAALEALGSDADSDDESQTVEDALKVEETKVTSKITARVEKVCAVKFLELCKRQRATINSILAYSMEIQSILDNIIGDGVEDEEDHRSYTIAVDSFDGIDTEQSEDLQSDEGCSDTIRQEVLESMQSAKSVEMERLKIEKESLLQQNRDLQEQIATTNRNLARVAAELREKEAELKEQEPIIKCCTAMRNRFFERTKAQRIGDEYVELHGTPNIPVIHAGNAAVHRGNWRVDIILAKRGLLTANNITKFGFWYDIDSTKSKFPDLIIDMMDMRATMLACLARTAYTHSKEREDSFAESYDWILGLYDDAVQKNPEDVQTVFSVPSSDQQVRKAFDNMKKICVEFETKQRIGIHRRVKYT